MPCFFPIGAYQFGAGLPLFFRPPQKHGAKYLQVPCGRCVGCRLEFARQWSVRCVHEASLHEQNSFCTFTYDAAHLPASYSLVPRDFTLFLKRLRKDYDVRYYMCGEYGDITGRPHYHACLFGFRPPDCIKYSQNVRGDLTYTSKYLDAKWRLGNVIVGDVTFESAGYCARYVMKKVKEDGPMREIFNVETGEIFKRHHEFARMSRRPALGLEWFTRYSSDVYPHDRVVIRGVKSKPPRFYDKRYELLNADKMAELKRKRFLLSDARAVDSSPRRLRDRKVVQDAAISRMKRSV